MKDFSIYVAGPYSAKHKIQIQHNVDVAVSTGAQLLKAGWQVYIPHLTHYTADYFPEELRRNTEFWLKQDLYWLDLCDAIYLLPNWENSKGAMREFEFAERKNIPRVFHAAEALELLRHFNGGK